MKDPRLLTVQDQKQLLLSPKQPFIDKNNLLDSAT
jgi:hypothetical protein